MKMSYLLSVAAMLLATGTAQARAHRAWPYKDLLVESDLVVIANAIDTKAVPNTDDMAQNRLQGFRTSFQQVETTFRVNVLLKGKHENKDLQLVHFLLGPHTGGLDNGPVLVAFRRSKRFEKGQGLERVYGPEYLLFLKARKDGKYEPVSGQVDPDESARVLEPPPYTFGEL